MSKHKLNIRRIKEHHCKGQGYCDIWPKCPFICPFEVDKDSPRIWKNPAPDAFDHLTQLKHTGKITFNGQDSPKQSKKSSQAKKHQYPCRLWLEERSCVQCRQEAEEREFWGDDK